MRQKRIKKVQTLLEQNNLDGFILFNKEYSNRPNVQYLSGFTGSYCILLLTKKENHIITDSRYFVQAEEESTFNLIKQKIRNPWNLIKKVLNDLKIKKLGYEYDKLDVKKYDKLKTLVENLKGFNNLFINMRKIKDKQEIKIIKKACEIASNAFMNFYPRIKIGMTEAELAAELTYEMRKLGAQEPTKGHFVIASGIRGQRPHGVFTNKVIEDGDLITFDFGAKYNGYVSDITRTIGIGNVSDELKNIYKIVLEAQKKAIIKASSNLSGNELDEVARNYISSKGYGNYFTHSTGHGIGLEIHELPMINKYNTDSLPVNSVVTIEPGIYIPGLGGVRIEDDIVVKENGCEVLSTAEKKLIIIN